MNERIKEKSPEGTGTRRYDIPHKIWEGIERIPEYSKFSASLVISKGDLFGAYRNTKIALRLIVPGKAKSKFSRRGKGTLSYKKPNDRFPQPSNNFYHKPSHFQNHSPAKWRLSRPPENDK